MKFAGAFPLAAAALMMLADPAAGQANPSTLNIAQNYHQRVNAAFSARMNGASTNECGRRVITAWDPTNRADYYWAMASDPAANRETKVTTSTFTFSGGVLTIPHSGVWVLGMSARCDQQACDFILQTANGATNLAGAGTDLVERVEDSWGGLGWSSHHVTTAEYLSDGDTVRVYLDSGSSDDCIRDTDKYYGHLWAVLVMPDTEFSTTAPQNG